MRYSISLSLIVRFQQMQWRNTLPKCWLTARSVISENPVISKSNWEIMTQKKTPVSKVLSDFLSPLTLTSKSVLSVILIIAVRFDLILQSKLGPSVSPRSIRTASRTSTRKRSLSRSGASHLIFWLLPNP